MVDLFKPPQVMHPRRSLKRWSTDCRLALASATKKELRTNKQGDCPVFDCPTSTARALHSPLVANCEQHPTLSEYESLLYTESRSVIDRQRYASGLKIQVT